MARLAVWRPPGDYLGVRRKLEGMLVLFEVPSSELAVLALSGDDALAQVAAHGRGLARVQSEDFGG